MSWFAIVEESTGRLISTGSVIAPVLPLGIIAIPISGPPDPDQMWNAQTQQFVARPPKVLIDRLDDIRARSGIIATLQAITPDQRQIIMDTFIWLLGNRRFRVQGMDPNL